MNSVEWAAEVLEDAASEWKAGGKFTDNEDAQSILRTVESVYAMVGDSPEEIGRTLVAIGSALSAWRNESPPAKHGKRLSDMAEHFRALAEIQASQ